PKKYSLCAGSPCLRNLRCLTQNAAPVGQGVLFLQIRRTGEISLLQAIPFRVDSGTFQEFRQSRLNLADILPIFQDNP
ncbi:MAG: hypothetical protein RL386_321, partial [Bacteroidota bacterium]